MLNQVIKRDGTKEPFDENKMKKSIEDAGHDANLTDDRITAIVGQIDGAVMGMAADKEEIATSELGSFILAQLNQVEPTAAEAWKKHEAEKAEPKPIV